MEWNVPLLARRHGVVPPVPSRRLTGGEVAVIAEVAPPFCVHSEVVQQVDHDGLDFLPVNTLGSVVHERAPQVALVVPPEVVHTRTGVGMNLTSYLIAEVSRWRLDFEPVEDVQFGAELAKRFGRSGDIGGGARMSEQRGPAKERGDVGFGREMGRQELFILGGLRCRCCDQVDGARGY